MEEGAAASVEGAAGGGGAAAASHSSAANATTAPTKMGEKVRKKIKKMNFIEMRTLSICFIGSTKLYNYKFGYMYFQLYNS